MEGALARVEVDARDAPALTRQRDREMHGAGRFARAALFIGKDDAVWCGRRREASHGALRFSCWRGMGGPRAKWYSRANIGGRRAVQIIRDIAMMHRAVTALKQNRK